MKITLMEGSPKEIAEYVKNLSVSDPKNIGRGSAVINYDFCKKLWGEKK